MRQRAPSPPPLTTKATSRAPAPPPRGLVRRPSAGRAGGSAGEHRRLLPSDALASYIAHFWHVAWDLPAPELAETLPHPSVHLVFEQGADRRRADVAGVPTRRFRRVLEGRGQVFGVKFRPAMFRALLDHGVGDLTDRVVAVEGVLDGAAAWTDTVFAAGSFEERITAAESFLALRLPAPPVELLALRDLVERIAVDPTLLRVEEVARLGGLDRRSLERRFRDCVGVTPKWVIQRYRLHEAAERLRGPNPPPLASLAADLGYADQAHLSRDFKATVGCTPRQFLQRMGSR